MQFKCFLMSLLGFLSYWFLFLIYYFLIFSKCMFPLLTLKYLTQATIQIVVNYAKHYTMLFYIILYLGWWIPDFEAKFTVFLEFYVFPFISLYKALFIDFHFCQVTYFSQYQLPLPHLHLICAFFPRSYEVINELTKLCISFPCLLLK